MRQTRSEDEAERWLAEEMARTPIRFCPLLNGMCRVDCQCYVIPEIKENHKGSGRTPIVEYEVCVGYCDNAMFEPYRSVDNFC